MTTREINGYQLQRVREHVWEIPQTSEMEVPARLLASESLLEQIGDDNTLDQLTNAAQLPGIIFSPLSNSLFEFGLDSQSLTSSNALIPIAYYIHHHNPELSWESKEGSETRRRIHYWLTSALLNGTFNSRPDEVLQDARGAIQDSDGAFPLEEIHHQMRGRGKVVGFSPDVIESLLDETTYRSQKSFLLLSLLYYPEPVKQNVTYQRDHIFPKSMLDIETLVEEYDLSVENAQRCENRRDAIANLQLLTPTENAEKSDVDFEEWIMTRTDEYYERHLIPTDERLHRIENFPEFVDRREQLIREDVSEKFSSFE